MKPIHDIEIEKKILHSLVKKPKMITEAIAKIVPAAFYTQTHKKVYEKMVSLHESGLSCDYDTLFSSLSEDATLQECVNQLESNFPSTAYFPSWCKSLMLTYARRVISQESGNLANIAGTDEDIESTTAIAIKKINTAIELSKHKASVSTDEVLRESITFIQQINDDPNQFIVPYYIQGMDEELKHARKQIHVLAAPPNTGKTGFALSVLEQQIQHGIKHVIFCHETPRVYLMNRLISMRANISSEQLFEISSGGNMSKLLKTTESLKNQTEMFRIYGSGDYSHSVEGIYSAIESMMDAGYKPDMVTIDYLQNLRPSISVGRSPRSEQIESMVMDLSRLFKNLDIAGLWLSQINRDKNRDQTNKAFINADLKGSSAIEQEADYVTFIKRKRPADDKGLTDMEWYSTKMRAGHMVRCEIGFNIGNGRFMGITNNRFAGSV